MKKISLLVVDDEQIAVWGIARTIQWKEVGIDEIYEAYDTEDALEILLNKDIDIVISDIEMPGKSGIELLKWIKNNSPETETIILTAHAVFEYARDALFLGSVNYLLKPVEHSTLKDEVILIVDEIKRKSDLLKFQRIHNNRLNTLEQHVPTMIENFWCNILNRQSNLTKEKIDYFLEIYRIPLSSKMEVTPILVNIDGMKQQNVKKQEDKINPVRQCIQELFFCSYNGNDIVYEDEIILLVYDEQRKDINYEDVLNELSLKCENAIQCSVCFYIGNTISMEKLSGEYERLSWISRRNLVDQKMRVYQKGYQLCNTEVIKSPPIIADWVSILIKGEKEEFTSKFDSLFCELQKNTPVDIYIIEEIFIGLNYMFFVAARKNGIIGNFCNFNNNRKGFVKTIDYLRIWTRKATEEYFNNLSTSEKNTSEIVRKVEKYVCNHIKEDIKREDIANALYFNPSYLSRIFKIERGVSLNEFVNCLKLEQAKKIFDTTDMSVSVTASEIGYYNFSYFSKQFKDLYGMTPSEYRKIRLK